MASRDKKILDAAQGLFMRYGTARTTMADIANAAGIARQTLYNAYPNKDEVLRAVVRTAGQDTIAQVREIWVTSPDLSDKIDVYFAHVPLAWFDMVETLPDAAEMIDGMHSVAQAEIADVMAEWRSMFAAAFADAGYADATTLADFFISSSKNAKFDVVSRTALVQRLDVLKQATMALLDR